MVSIEAWRCSIGTHNLRARNHEFRDNYESNDIVTGSILLRSSLSNSIMSVKLICMLLMIGCIEMNPGPVSGRAEGIQTKMIK